MHHNLRCLACGSDRFAIFRTNDKKLNTSTLSPDEPQKRDSRKIDYQSDYDMLKANEQFKKLMGEDSEDNVTIKQEATDPELKDQAKTDPSVEDIAKSLLKPRVDAKPGYDKSKSFFDDLSRDTKPKAPKKSVDQRILRQFIRFPRNQQIFGRGDYNHYDRPNIDRGYYPPQRNDKWYEERARNQQTFGQMNSFDPRPNGIPNLPGYGGYSPRNWQPRKHYGNGLAY